MDLAERLKAISDVSGKYSSWKLDTSIARAGEQYDTAEATEEGGGGQSTGNVSWDPVSLRSTGLSRRGAPPARLASVHTSIPSTSVDPAAPQRRSGTRAADCDELGLLERQLTERGLLGCDGRCEERDDCGGS